MSRLDLVIFGATGFTGKHAVAEMARMAEDYPGITWGVAGRNKEKLETLMADVASKTGKDVSQTKIIVADIGDGESLKAMCAQAKVIVNCCGPYRFLGEPMVQAAIDSRAHYVDVSGEPQFMESMQLKYDGAAQQAGVFVVSACGFDSIPADLGVLYLQQNFPGILNSVEAFLSFEHTPPGLWRRALWSGSIHYGTWESLVYSLAHRSELPALRRKLFPQRLPPFKPNLPLKMIHSRHGRACVPLLTADAAVVRRSQRRLYETEGARPAHFRAYLRAGWLGGALLALAGLLLLLMSSYSLTRRLLLNYPRLFSLGAVSRAGPSRAVMEGTRFTFELEGEGWARDERGVCDVVAPPNKRLGAKVCGTNPGYGATVVALLLSAVTIVKERNLMPPAGGVLSPAAAFNKTAIIEKLHKRNLTFEIISRE